MSRFSQMATVVTAFAMALALAGCSGASQPSVTPPPATSTQPTDPDRELVDRKCSMCHSTDQVYSATYDVTGWTTVLDRMQKNGLVISSDERARVIEYLAGR